MGFPTLALSLQEPAASAGGVAPVEWGLLVLVEGALNSPG